MLSAVGVMAIGVGSLWATPAAITVSDFVTTGSLVRGQTFEGSVTLTITSDHTWAASPTAAVVAALDVGALGTDPWSAGTGSPATCERTSDKVVSCRIRGITAANGTEAFSVGGGENIPATAFLPEASASFDAGEINPAEVPTLEAATASFTLTVPAAERLGHKPVLFAMCRSGTQEYTGVNRTATSGGFAANSPQNGCATLVAGTDQNPRAIEANGVVTTGDELLMRWVPTSRPGRGTTLSGTGFEWEQTGDELVATIEDFIGKYTSANRTFNIGIGNITADLNPDVVSTVRAWRDFRINVLYNGSAQNPPSWVTGMSIALVTPGSTAEEAALEAPEFENFYYRHVAPSRGTTGENRRLFSFGDVGNIIGREIWINGEYSGRKIAAIGSVLDATGCLAADCVALINVVDVSFVFADSVEAVARYGGPADGTGLSLTVTSVRSEEEETNYWVGNVLDTVLANGTIHVRRAAVLGAEADDGAKLQITINGYVKEGCGIFTTAETASTGTAIALANFPGAPSCEEEEGVSVEYVVKHASATAAQTVTIGVGTTIAAGTTALLPEMLQIVADSLTWDDIKGENNIWGPSGIRFPLVNLGNRNMTSLSALCAGANCHTLANAKAGAGRAIWTALGRPGVSTELAKITLAFEFEESNAPPSADPSIAVGSGAITRSDDRDATGVLSVIGRVGTIESATAQVLDVEVVRKEVMTARITSPEGAVTDENGNNVVWVTAGTRLNAFTMSGIGVCRDPLKLDDPDCDSILPSTDFTVQWYAQDQYSGGDDFTGGALSHTGAGSWQINRDTVMIVRVAPTVAGGANYINEPFLYVVEFRLVESGTVVIRVQPSIPEGVRFFQGFIGSISPNTNRQLRVTDVVGSPTNTNAPVYRWFKLDGISEGITCDNISEFGIAAPGQSTTATGSRTYDLPTTGTNALAAGDHYYAVRITRGSGDAFWCTMSDIVTVTVEEWVPATSITFDATTIDVGTLTTQGGGANRAAVFPLNTTVGPENASRTDIVWTILPLRTTANVEFNEDGTALLVRSNGTVNLRGVIVGGRGTNPYPGTNLQIDNLLTFEGSVGVAEVSRDVPVDVPAEVVVVAPVAPRVTITAGPNPASRGDGRMAFFGDEAVASGTLRIFDASGNLVRSIAVSAPDANGVVATWDLSDARGRTVGEGTYLVRGALVTVAGQRVAVNALVGISR